MAETITLAIMSYTLSPENVLFYLVLTKLGILPLRFISGTTSYCSRVCLQYENVAGELQKREDSSF